MQHSAYGESRTSNPLISSLAFLPLSHNAPYGLNGPQGEKTCLRWFTDNKGADQPAHQCRLISTFVIRFLENMIYKLAISNISRKTGLSLALLETLKTGFVVFGPK